MEQRGGIRFATDDEGRVTLACSQCDTDTGAIIGVMVQKRFTATVIQLGEIKQIETEGEDWMDEKTGIVMVNIQYRCKNGHATTFAFRGRTEEVEVLAIWLKRNA